jgi:hypothetical protein
MHRDNLRIKNLLCGGVEKGDAGWQRRTYNASECRIYTTGGGGTMVNPLI